MDPQVDRVVASARASGIDIRDRVGSTGYCESWSVGEALVMRIPRSRFPEPTPAHGQGPVVGDYFSPEDGHVFGAVDSALLARTLLESSTERTRGASGPLARFVDRIELDGVAVALHERAIGRPPAGADLRAVVRALAALHEAFGHHGHLAPSHIFIDGERVTFTDPLPIHPLLLGAAGYALPIAARDPADPRDEGMLLRDVAALGAIAAELHGCDVGWTVDVVRHLDTVANRAITRPWDPRPALLELRRRTQAIADPASRGWIDAAARLCLDHYVPAPGVRPTTTAPRAATPGTARSLLVDFDRHAALGAIATRLEASPSLFDFVAGERAAAIESRALPDLAQAHAACERSFAHIVAALPEIEAAYRGVSPGAGALPPILHPREVYEESHALRALLLDLDRLLAPTPDVLADAAARLARVHATLAALGEPAIRTAAARRLVNYVTQISR